MNQNFALFQAQNQKQTNALLYTNLEPKLRMTAASNQYVKSWTFSLKFVDIYLLLQDVRLTTNDVFFAVKTCGKYHTDRGKRCLI